RRRSSSTTSTRTVLVWLTLRPYRGVRGVVPPRASRADYPRRPLRVLTAAVRQCGIHDSVTEAVPAGQVGDPRRRPGHHRRGPGRSLITAAQAAPGLPARTAAQ